MVGGIIINSHKLNEVTILKCQIYKNKLTGIYSIGELSQTTISQCQIYDNYGPGITIGTCNSAKVPFLFR